MKVERYARERIKYANIYMEFVGATYKGPAQIRVAFDRKGGTWLYSRAPAPSQRNTMGEKESVRILQASNILNKTRNGWKKYL